MLAETINRVDPGECSRIPTVTVNHRPSTQHSHNIMHGLYQNCEKLFLQTELKSKKLFVAYKMACVNKNMMLTYLQAAALNQR